MGNPEHLDICFGSYGRRPRVSVQKRKMPKDTTFGNDVDVHPGVFGWNLEDDISFTFEKQEEIGVSIPLGENLFILGEFLSRAHLSQFLQLFLRIIHKNPI